MKTFWKLGLAAWLAGQALLAQAAVTGMKFISTPGDYIGGGTTQTYKAPTATFSTTGETGRVQVVISEGSHFWMLNFAAPQGSALTRTSYPNAARYPFQSPLGAGMDVSGDGRGCNTLKGWFRVHEFELAPDNTVIRLAIDFEQNCEVTMPPLYGALRINSRRALTVPDLEAVAGADFAVYGGQTVTLDGSQSFSRRRPSGLTYQWTQIAGPTVTLDNAAAMRPNFTAPPVPLAGDSLQFRLQVSDGGRQTSTDDVVLLVQNPSVPRTEFSFQGDAGDYISQGRSWFYDRNNAAFSVARNFANGVSVGVTGATWWYFDTAAAGNAPLTVGTYQNAVRFPFQPPESPGLSLSGDGRGCNTLTGQFTVHQAQFDAGGTPQVLEITFEQHCEGGAPAAYGRLLVNASPSAPVAAGIAKLRQRLGSRP